MRAHLFVSFSISLFALSAPSVWAGPAKPAGVTRVAAPVLPAIDAQSVPAACKSLLGAAQSPSPQAAVPARMSLASCMAEQAIAPLALCDCGQSIVDIDQAVAPAIAVLDGVSQVGGPVSQAMAAHAKGTLYAGFVMRMTATVPKLGQSATPQEMSLHDMRAQALDPQLAPWRDAARSAFTQVLELAKTHPEIARNASVATAIRDSQQRMAADVATRETQAKSAAAVPANDDAPADQPNDKLDAKASDKPSAL